MAKFNVNFSESTYQALTDMSQRLDRPMAEVIREALSLYGWLIREASQGSTFMIQRGDRAPSELVIPYLERVQEPVAVPSAKEADDRSTAEVKSSRGRRSARGPATGRPLPT